jgi:hypothetical protein
VTCVTSSYIYITSSYIFVTSTQVYKNVCWKSSLLTENKDLVPKACRVWNPAEHWDEDEWWQLVKLFQSKKTSSRINREDTQGGSPS